MTQNHSKNKALVAVTRENKPAVDAAALCKPAAGMTAPDQAEGAAAAVHLTETNPAEENEAGHSGLSYRACIFVKQVNMMNLPVPKSLD